MSFNRYCLIGLRAEKKIPITRVAWDTFIDTAVILRIENGSTKNPRFDTIVTLANYFKVNVETFRGEV